MAIVTVSGVSYHIDNKLKAKWDRIKDGKLKKQDTDRVYVVDGRERTGKSVFAMQQACYIDPTLVNDLSRICFTAEEFLEAIRKTDSDEKITRCIIFDEAFRGLASRGAMSKINKTIVQALMEVGQKNLVLWIVLPSFFMLDLYPAMIRSNALFHVAQEKGTNKRVFYVYPHSKKGILYQNGIRKGWQYNIRTMNKGRFFNKFPNDVFKESGNTFYQDYLKKKRLSLTEDEEQGEVKAESTKERKLMEACWRMNKEQGLSYMKIKNKLKEMLDIDMSDVGIFKWIKKIDSERDFEVKKAMYYSEKAEKPLTINA